MEVFAVNKDVVKLNWLFLILWVLSAAGFIILLAAGSSYWVLALPGFIFLYLWQLRDITYPRKVITSDDEILLIMSSGKEYKLEEHNVEIEIQDSAVALDFDDAGTIRKLRISRKKISPELLDILKTKITSNGQSGQSKEKI